jgi:protein TonB
VRWQEAIRLLLWATLGGIVALLLAFFMYTLIHSSEMRLSSVERVQMLDFVRLKREEVVQRRQRKPERPESGQAPDAPPMVEQTASAASETLTVSLPPQAPVRSGIDVARTGLGIGSGDGEYLPIVKVAPIYPRRALQRGVTGTCVVRYTVTTAGTVKDVEVVEEQCSDPVFYQPSLEAARRFKYKPRVIDGTPVEVVGVHNMFHYEIGEPPGAEGR